MVRLNGSLSRKRERRRLGTSSQVLSPSAAAALAFSRSGSQVSQYLHGLSDLRKRMGDVRRTASDGLYAGMRGGKDRIEGHAAKTYRNQYRAVGLGLDRKVGESWIVGGAFEALEDNQTTRSNGASASGKSSGQNLRLYEPGLPTTASTPILLRASGASIRNSRPRWLDGTPVRGSTSGLTWGASVEVGRQFELSGAGGWFAEPQLQLSYLKVQGEDYTLTNRMRVEEKHADSLTGRAGLVLGKTILDEKANGCEIAVKGGLNHEFLGAVKIKVNGEAFDGVTLGTRGYCGLAVDWYATSRLRLFGQIEFEQGAHYTGEYNARLAMKYAF